MGFWRGGGGVRVRVSELGVFVASRSSAMPGEDSRSDQTYRHVFVAGSMVLGQGLRLGVFVGLLDSRLTVISYKDLERVS